MSINFVNDHAVLKPHIRSSRICPINQWYCHPICAWANVRSKRVEQGTSIEYWTCSYCNCDSFVYPVEQPKEEKVTEAEVLEEPVDEDNVIDVVPEEKEEEN